MSIARYTPYEIDGWSHRRLDCRGNFREGDEIIIGPGRKIENGNKSHWEPIETTITSMQGGGGKRDQMTAGGLCGFRNTS